MVKQAQEVWNSRLGVILAVAGSAVGLGNFLRFPGQVAQYGGGAFMVAYFISFLLIGLPVCWAEWTMGRFAGQRGFHSAVGMLHSVSRHPAGKYLGVIGIVIPVIIYMYYVLIEAWCLGYSLNFLAGNMDFADASDVGAFFNTFTGAEANGAGFGFKINQVGIFLVLCFALNFYLIYRGVARGIELFCRYAMPALIVLAILVLVRVLTLPANPDDPQKSISAGLGFMWNPHQVVLIEHAADGDPEKTTETAIFGRDYIAEAELRAAEDPLIEVVHLGLARQLSNPQLWLAAAGQIFFSLSVGFGVIITYSSYLTKKDDVVLSGLAACSANEFCEVALGGLITIPASVAFLGVAGISGAIGSTFALGFNVLPMVFSAMPLGALFGFFFFFLLFLAAVTSSLSMLQPGIAFLESALRINRKQSVGILGYITATGTLITVYFSHDFKVLDTLDFWAGTFLIYVLATIQIIIFAWVLGVDRGLKEASVGQKMRIPRFFGFVIKWISPSFLLVIFFVWVCDKLFGYNLFASEQGIPSYYVTDLFPQAGMNPNHAARIAVAIIVLFALFCVAIANSSIHFRKYSHTDVGNAEVKEEIP